jgi:CRISPR-associated endonuclease/helicase Cas3
VSAPFAHSVNDQGKAHDLAQHLNETAELAAVFASRFDSADFARCAGLWHDLGKNALDFQNQLLRSSDAYIEGGGGSGRVDHSSAGAIHALGTLKAGLGLPLAFVIAGHHSGLLDKTPDLDNRLADKPNFSAARARPAGCCQPGRCPPGHAVVATGWGYGSGGRSSPVRPPRSRSHPSAEQGRIVATP